MIARHLVDELGCKVHMLGSPEACLRVGDRGNYRRVWRVLVI